MNENMDITRTRYKINFGDSYFKEIEKLLDERYSDINIIITETLFNMGYSKDDVINMIMDNELERITYKENENQVLLLNGIPICLFNLETHLNIPLTLPTKH